MKDRILESDLKHL